MNYALEEKVINFERLFKTLQTNCNSEKLQDMRNSPNNIINKKYPERNKI